MVAHDPSKGGHPHESLGGHRAAMLSGFNTNFRYRGVLFHVQTEDSGLDNPHVITHLFHGGNIMVSVKQDYSDLLAGDGIQIAVKKLMEGQHKTILKQLSRGEHDGTIGERLGADIFLAEKQSGSRSSRAPSVTEEERPSEITNTAANADAGAGAKARGLTKSSRSRTSSGSATSSVTARSSAATRPATMAEATVVAEEPSTHPSQQETSATLSRVFGDRVLSEKPLDEVVLDYLVENARKRRRQPK